MDSEKIMILVIHENFWALVHNNKLLTLNKIENTFLFCKANYLHCGSPSVLAKGTIIEPF
jgi:hypothetical protein